MRTSNKDLIRVGFTLIVGMLGSGSAFAESGSSACLSIDFAPQRTECLQTVNNADFQSSALAACTSISFSPQRIECLQTIKNGVFSDAATDVCDNIFFAPQKIECLQTIRNKAYDSDIAQGCANSFAPSAIDCLAQVGTSIKQKPIKQAPVRTAVTTLQLGQSGWMLETDSTCGGSVETKASPNGEQVNLIFHDVTGCSNFDILDMNGKSLQYDDKKLQPQANGKLGGSFTIPKRFLEDGRNTFTLQVRSNSGAHKTMFNLRFRAHLSEAGDEESVQPAGHTAS